MGAWPTWFGPDDRPLFGWVHVPDDGRARAGVVLCPPLGTEGVCARWTLRMLAEQLAARGMMALRFDYDGTGDSAGAGEDPDRVPAWLASVSSAVAAVRGAGAARVVVVGMRVGATLAALGAGSDKPDALVLWDPCTSGRSYLRAQRALLAVSRPVRPTDDGSVEVPGILYDPATVEALSALNIADAEVPSAQEVLVMVRPDRPPDRALSEKLSIPHVTWGSAEGQASLVDVTPDNVVVPESTVEAVASWISGALDALGADFVPVSPPARDTAVVGGAGRPVREQLVRIGPIGLFGVLCQPERSSDGPTAVFLNCGSQDHTGPARLWVELAREWAGAGLRSLRVDLSGLGDSPLRGGQAPLLMYPPEAFDDLADIVGYASPDPRQQFMVGLCSGGYHAVEAGLQLGIGGVCLVNPSLTAHPSELAHVADSNSVTAADDPRPLGPAKTIDPRRQASTATRRLVRALPAHDFFGSIVNRLPDPAWWVIKRTVMHQAPARALETMLERGVEAFVVCGENEARTICQGERGRMRRMTDSGRMQFEVMPGIDHELFGSESRRRVRARVTEHVINRYAPTTGS